MYFFARNSDVRSGTILPVQKDVALEENDNGYNSGNENSFTPDNNYYASIKSVNTNEEKIVDLTNFYKYVRYPKIKNKRQRHFTNK